MFCPSCGAQLPTLAGAPTPEAVRKITAGQQPFKPQAEVATVADGVAPLVRSGSSQMAKGAWGRLVAVNRDGSDGPAYHLSGEFADLGTGAVTVRVAGDSHVAPRHLRLERRGEAVTAVPLDELNGVMWRLREPTEVLSGAVVLLGRELCRIDLISPADGEIRGLRQHGVELFASPPRRAWARLSHLWTNGAIGDVRHFFSDEVVIGREEGDIIFADDEFLSRRHAIFRRRDNRCILEDLGSSNGTFVRLDGPTLVSSGDFLRVGDHMFRFESIGS